MNILKVSGFRFNLHHKQEAQIAQLRNDSLDKISVMKSRTNYLYNVRKWILKFSPAILTLNIEHQLSLDDFIAIFYI